jgi:LPXTG-motif cell wall-anchored protein
LARRLITALLGASLALVLGATGAMASADLTTPEKLASAKSKLLRQRLLDLTAKAGAAAVEEGDPPAEGEEPPPPECLGEDAPEIKALIDKLFEDATEIEANDDQLNELNVAFLAAQEKFIADLESAESAAQVNAAYEAFVEAVEVYFDGYKARITELKPAFAELSADFITALKDAGACEELVDEIEADLNGGQFFIDFTKFFLDEGRKAALEAAAQLRDQALEALPPPPPGGQPPVGGGPVEAPGRGGAELPATGANSAAFLLLAGLALISGGTTAIVATRRRRASA